MTSRPLKRIVRSPDQVAENIRRYQQSLAKSPDLVARMSRHPAWYAVRGEDGQWLFGPSKFIGYEGITAKEYLAGYDRGDGRETERVLKEWFRVVDLDSALGREIEAQFRDFFSRYAKVPKKLWRISVPFDALGAEISSKARDVTGSKMVAERITVNPEICGGRPCIKGTRVRVSDILDMIAHGVSPDQIVGDYPYLDRKDIVAALAYAAQAVDHRVVRAA